ncbi:MAG: YtxH domain-containing protein [Rikenellaceae bacterium]
MKSNGLISLMCGALAGATAAILLAPKSGAQTRSDIKNMIDEHLRHAKKKSKMLHEQIQRKLEDTIGEKQEI